LTLLGAQIPESRYSAVASYDEYMSTETQHCTAEISYYALGLHQVTITEKVLSNKI